MSDHELKEASKPFYTNSIGKSRPALEPAEAARESALRKEYFERFRAEMLPLMEAAGFVQPDLYLTGSTARNQASTDSDIDFGIKFRGFTAGDTQQAEYTARRIFAQLQQQWQEQGKYQYELQIWTGDEGTFVNPVNILRQKMRQGM